MVDLTKSGRTSWIEAYKLRSIFSVMTPISRWERIDGVVGGSLSWKYFSTLKTSGSLEIHNGDPAIGHYIRIFYCSDLGTETTKDLLGTWYAAPQIGTLRRGDGSWSGTIDLKSTLTRYDELHLSKNIAFGANAGNSMPLRFFHSQMRQFGGEYVTDATDYKRSSEHVFGFGEKAMDMLQTLADWLNAEIGVDRYGRLTMLVKYGQSFHRRRDPFFANLALTDYDSEDNSFDTPNTVYVLVRNNKRVNVDGKLETVENVRYGSASLANGDSLSASAVGRKISRTYDVTVPDNVVNDSDSRWRDKLARSRLSRLVVGNRKTRISIPFARLDLERLVQHPIIDSDGTYRYDTGYVTGIDMDLTGPMGVMKLEITSRAEIKANDEAAKDRAKDYQGVWE